MDKKRKDRDGFEGRLPAMAPLANGYVPFQLENPPQFDARTAIVRGTLYPGLELPFMGMVNKKHLASTPLAELQTLGFALHELALYLDTHRDDAEALQLYCQYQKIYHDGMMQYTHDCGQLNHMTPGSSAGYAWLDDPWPWEYCKN